MVLGGCWEIFCVGMSIGVVICLSGVVQVCGECDE